jgi:citrate lyase subunit beta/citryl-CoA lyase
MRRHANRTYLFAPGNHARRVEKALGLGADAVILDLEDAVAIAEKPATRAIVREALARPRDCAGFVRVNAYDTEFCHGDIDAIVAEGLDGIVLPKLESAADIKSVDWLLTNLERERGLRLAFGGGDYTRDLGMDWSLGESELLPVRSEMVLASRHGGLEPPVDTVFIHIKEHEAFRASCELVRGLGFQGKMCIHPDQVPAANAVFTPAPDAIAWSERIVAAFEEAEKAGIASIQVDGYFVDYPIVEKARRTLDTATLLRDLGKL